MFIQNPHPIYRALLENSYEVIKKDHSKSIKWYELNCKNYKLMIGFENESVHGTDYSDSNNLKYTILPTNISIYNNNDHDENKDKDIDCR